MVFLLQFLPKKIILIINILLIFHYKKTNSKSVQKNTNSINIKYGERLYQKGIAYKKLIENKIQKLKKSILDKQLTQCTFHPKTLKVRVISIEKIKKNKKKYKERKSNDYNNNYFQKSL